MTANKRTDPPRTRERKRRAPAAVAQVASGNGKQPSAAGLHNIDPQPAGIPMFPIAPAAWLAPNFVVAVPQSAGVRPERGFRTGFGSFARVDVTPVRMNDERIGPEFCHPAKRAIVPAGDLRPLPWEARAVARSPRLS